MPRIRTIKPEFFDSPDTAKASYEARLFFIALWCWADDYGIGTANPKQLIGFAFPNDPVTDTEFPRIRTEVETCFGIVWYEVDGRPYYAIPSWEEHQKNERRSKRRNPGPELASDKGKHGTSDDTHGSSAQLSENVPIGTGEQRNRGTEEQGKSKSISSEVAVATVRPDVTEILDYLDQALIANDPDAKLPGRIKKNLDAGRLLLDRDGKTVAQVKSCIDFATTDEFWRVNIRSMSKLRDKYEQLRSAAIAKAAKVNRPSIRQQQSDDFLNRAMAWAEAADQQEVQ